MSRTKVIFLCAAFILTGVFLVPTSASAIDACNCTVKVTEPGGACASGYEVFASYELGKAQISILETAQRLVGQSPCAAPAAIFNGLPGSAANKIDIKDDASCSRIKADGKEGDYEYTLSCSIGEVKEPNRGRGIIELCADPKLVPGQAGCRDANILLLQVIRITDYLFGIIGSIAFLFFIYGGFTLILSFGNAERAKKAQQILAAAAVGLLIAFGSVILIDFVLEALDVDSSYLL